MEAWIQLFVYAVIIIWGAATTKTEIKNLGRELREFKETAKAAGELVAATLSDHGERISRIEGKLDS